MPDRQMLGRRRGSHLIGRARIEDPVVVSGQLDLVVAVPLREFIEDSIEHQPELRQRHGQRDVHAGSQSVLPCGPVGVL